MKKLVFSLILILCSAGALPALTTEEVLQLKKSGISDETIRLMIQDDRDKRQQNRTSIRIIHSENATVYSTGEPSDTPLSREQQRNVDRAWEMLKNLNLEIEN
ncbi:hypothetical protein ACFL43_01615 [Thermodesulfobacteriota bacterium]